MIQFFSQMVDNRARGSAVYVESLQRVFVQDGGSGLIEVQCAPDCQLVYLYLDGQPVGIYHLRPEGGRLISGDEVRGVWSYGEAEVRCVSVPSQALRCAEQALEWHPPQQELELSGVDARLYLDNLKAQRQDGLLRLSLPDLDGFVVLLNGEALVTEAVFATRRGIESMALSLDEWANKLQGGARLGWYAARQESFSYQRLLLRNAVNRWVAQIITGYQNLVGRALVNSLDYEMNTALRLRRWNLRLVGGGLVDHHFFLNVAVALQSYQAVLEILDAQMVRVVGKGLAERAFSQAFEKLQERQRQILLAHSLVPFGSVKSTAE